MWGKLGSESNKPPDNRPGVEQTTTHCVFVPCTLEKRILRMRTPQGTIQMIYFAPTGTHP